MAMTLRLTDEMDAKLSAFADKSGLSKQKAMEKLIDEADFSAARKVQLDQIFDKVMTRDAKLMERLADA